MTASRIILSKDSVQLELSIDENQKGGKYLLNCLQDGIYDSIDVYLNKEELKQIANNILNAIDDLENNK